MAEMARVMKGPPEIGELRREVAQLRRVNDRGERPSPASSRVQRPSARRTPPKRRPPRTAYARRRLVLLGVVALVVAILVVVAGSTQVKTFAPPTRSALAGLSVRQRIVKIAESQLGYHTTPVRSYCNKFSAAWGAGASSCPAGEASEEWCADFAAWVWRRAGVSFDYGYGADEINAGAVSFYNWAVNAGRWHPVGSGFRAAPGDVAVYGLSLAGTPTAAHVAIVTSDATSQSGPDVINGDGDRTGFSVVETGTDQGRADTGRGGGAPLAGYVSPF